MKREIIFRGKRLDNREWVQGYPFVSDTDNSAFILCGSCDSREDKFEVAPDTIGQFTGMTDKNGKRIFEGDIVCSKMKYGESKGIIVFRNGRFSVDWRVRSKWSGNGISCRTDDLSPSDEVLGTMFDNPELLEVKS